MKNYSKYQLLVLALFPLVMTISACEKDNPESLTYSTTEKPLGKSYEEWSIDFWQNLLSHDCNTFAGASAETQTGEVHFLSFMLGTSASDVTIPSDKSILVPVFNYINDYPCPDTSFHPAVGQSLEAFLLEGAVSNIDLAKDIKVTLDGRNIPVNNDNRVKTHLFYFTGNPDIASCFDPCITGSSQAGVSDGYWLFFKPLKKGQHILHIEFNIPVWTPPLNNSVSFNITVP